MTFDDKPEYLSYSSFSTFLDCGWKWYLTRVMKVEEQPAVWLPAGTAIHSAADAIDHAIFKRDQEVPF